MICSQTHLNGRPGQHVVLIVVELGEALGSSSKDLSPRSGPGSASEIVCITGLLEMGSFNFHLLLMVLNISINYNLSTE